MYEYEQQQRDCTQYVHTQVQTHTQTQSQIAVKTEAKPEFSVSQLSAMLKNIVETNFSSIRVRGEISGLKIPSSGHMYFSLKDENSLIAAICWKGVTSSLKIKLEDGMEVIATGSITIYPMQSKYQIIVNKIELSGVGSLMALLDKRKNMFMAEGLFDAAHKKPLPKFPDRIGVITSATGSVIQDILHRLGDRYPVPVSLWPVAVQGEACAAQVAKAIYGMNNLDDSVKPSVIIIARGGGSIEDLWGFNEEIVIRACFASAIPVISAIGHETDTTLLDYVADCRAPTPTAAAELATPVGSEILNNIADYSRNIKRTVLGKLEIATGRVGLYSTRLITPTKYLDRKSNDLLTLTHGLTTCYSSMLSVRLNKFTKIASSLNRQLISSRIESANVQLKNLNTRMMLALSKLIDLADLKIKNLDMLLESYNHNAVLKRGFAIIKDCDDRIITSVKNAQGKMKVIMHDGDVDVTLS